MRKIISSVIVLSLIFIGALIYFRLTNYFNENKALKEIILCLEADTRIAEVFVSDVNIDPGTGKALTTIKFLEYDSRNMPLKPRYFTFSGNIIQFQSLVVRFDDAYIEQKDILRGKSAYLFWKVFMLDGPNTQEFAITEVGSVPQGYKINDADNPFERKLWKNFWKYAFNSEESRKIGVKNAQIEAPGTMFIPGTLYILKIEHDGGIRIDVQPIPEVLKGEHVPR